MLVEIPELAEPDRLRFHSKIAAPNERGCRMWTLGKTRGGYGKFKVAGKTCLAHRIAISLAGRAPTSAQPCVLHDCDTPACCEPTHLFLGTLQDNNADKQAKGRQAKGVTSGRHTKPERTARGDRHGARLHPESLCRGESVNTSKLTADLIPMIRADPRKQSEIAAAYGVSQQTIWSIKQRKIWAHIGEAA